MDSAICTVTSELRNCVAARVLGVLAGVRAQRRDEVGARAVQRRIHPEQQSGEDRQTGRERDHGRIDARTSRRRARRAGAGRREPSERPARDEQAHDAAKHARARTTP